MEMRIEHREYDGSIKPVLVAVDGYGRRWVFALRQLEGPVTQMIPNGMVLSEAPIG